MKFETILSMHRPEPLIRYSCSHLDPRLTGDRDENRICDDLERRSLVSCLLFQFYTSFARQTKPFARIPDLPDGSAPPSGPVSLFTEKI